MKKNKYIEIVTSPIGGFNLMPYKTLLNLHEKLAENYNKVKISIIHTLNDLNELVAKKPDLVIAGIKYLIFDSNETKRDATDKIWFSEFLDKHNISYTGSSKEAIELEFDKSKAKQIVHDCGLKTALYFLAKPNQFKENEIPLSYPLFVKPLFEGDSRGIDSSSLVHCYGEYKKKVKSIFETQHTVSLVETYLSGKEYTVAIIEDINNDSYEVYPIEIIAKKNDRGDRILGFKDKQEDKEQTLTISNEHIKKMVSRLALKSFKALQAKGYGRIDIKMNDAGTPYFIEANLIPGLGHGYFYRCYNLNTGFNHEKMILDIVENSIASINTLFFPNQPITAKAMPVFHHTLSSSLPFESDPAFYPA